MPRRTFLATVAGGLLATPLAAEAQQAGRVPVVGVLNSGMGPRALTVDTTRQGLRELGYVEGKTITFEVRFAGAKVEAFPGLAARSTSSCSRRQCRRHADSGSSRVPAIRHPRTDTSWRTR
jgi:putative ABC transport system substrate-binding protein